ncbi:hypothetical protein [Enterococcus sp. AZ192]|uniref:hypothetical protein n=1 Tax=unclassified Enterococcus TaxID=2608891 RepID=UPI003D292C97
MNNQEQNDFSTALSPSNFSTDHMPTAAKRQIHKDSCEVVRAVVRKNMIENGMSLITNTAMNNIANLSMLEQQLSDIAPNAEPRLKMIVDEYTIRANNRLGGN